MYSDGHKATGSQNRVELDYQSGAKNGIYFNNGPVESLTGLFNLGITDFLNGAFGGKKLGAFNVDEP